MKLINKKENQIEFVAEVSESLANAVRRYLNHIPVLAIDEVEILKNDSPLYDETVAHRIGLIPLKTDKSMNDKTIAKLKLSVKKPGMVYSGDFTGNAEIVYDKIPITSLNKSQELEILATAKMGIGNKHAKFSPGLMFYRNVVDVKINKNCPKEIIDFCPQKILKEKNGKVVVEDNLKCDMCEVCVEECKRQEKFDAIKISPTKELKISLESFGQLSVEEIFKNSIEALKKDLNEVSKKVGKIK